MGWLARETKTKALSVASEGSNNPEKPVVSHFGFLG
jgi:hypothetical protein